MRWALDGSATAYSQLCSRIWMKRPALPLVRGV